MSDGKEWIFGQLSDNSREKSKGSLLGEFVSRYFDVEVEVKNVPKDKEEAIAKVIGEEAVDSLDDYSFYLKADAEIGEIVCQDNTNLAGGESPEEAHGRITDAIKKVAPEAIVTTKWHYSEWEWDEIYTGLG